MEATVVVTNPALLGYPSVLLAFLGSRFITFGRIYLFVLIRLRFETPDILFAYFPAAISYDFKPGISNGILLHYYN